MKKTFYTVGSLIILLICAFVFVLVPAMVGGGKQPETPSIGKYNGKSIRYEQDSDFANLVNQYGQYYQNMGYQIDNSTYFYIFNAAFNSTVAKMAAEDAVAKSGYTVPKSAVNRSMLPYFYDETGKYSSKLYKQTPEATINSMRKEISSSLVSSRFNDDHFGSSSEIVGSEALYGLKESDAELDFLASVGTKKRGFNMAVFPLKDFPEEEVVKFGKQNAAKFTSYDLSVITVADKATVNKVSKRIANNEITFEDAISLYSEKNYTDNEGKINNKYQYQIENILEDKANIAKITDLSAGSVSEPVQTSIGYSIFKMNSAKTAADFDDINIVRAVSTYISDYEASVIEDYFCAKAKDFTNEALKSDFATACEALNVNYVDVAPFPLNYASMAVSTSVDTTLDGLSGADTNENFLKTAFSLKMNEISAPIVMNKNVLVLQYTSDDNSAKEDAMILSALRDYDTDSTRDMIMASDKLENNFATVYFKYFMN